jgi:hypothetical protein
MFIKQLFIENGFKIEAVSASNSISTNKDNFLLDIRNNDIKWNDLLNYEEKSCYEPGMLDIGTHILICGKKTERHSNIHFTMTANAARIFKPLRGINCS